MGMEHVKEEMQHEHSLKMGKLRQVLGDNQQWKWAIVNAVVVVVVGVEEIEVVQEETMMMMSNIVCENMHMLRMLEHDNSRPHQAMERASHLVLVVVIGIVMDIELNQ